MMYLYDDNMTTLWFLASVREIFWLVNRTFWFVNENVLISLCCFNQCLSNQNQVAQRILRGTKSHDDFSKARHSSEIFENNHLSLNCGLGRLYKKRKHCFPSSLFFSPLLFLNKDKKDHVLYLETSVIIKFSGVTSGWYGDSWKLIRQNPFLSYHLHYSLVLWGPSGSGMERPWAEQAEFDRVPPGARGEGHAMAMAPK